MEVTVLNNFYRNLSLWVVIGLVVILLYNLFSVRPQPVTELVYSEFLSRVEAGEVEEVLLKGRDIAGKFQDGTQFSTYSAEDPDLVPYLREQGVRIVAEPAQDSPWYVTIFVSWFPMLLLIAVWIFFMRQMQAGGSKALSFGKSKARLLTPRKNSRRSSISSRIPRDSRGWEARFPRESSSWVRQGQAKPCWPGPSRGRLTCRSSPSAAPILWRCSWGWVHPG
jgi:hypothetical protein